MISVRTAIKSEARPTVKQLKSKKNNRKVQGVPQSETTTNPRHKEEEKYDKN